MATQTAVIVKKYGSQEDPTSGLEVDHVPVPELKDGEVLVRMKLRPVNPADVFSILGAYGGFKPASLPATNGLEGVGVVEENGPGTKGTFKKGQRVTAFGWKTKEGRGTWQQYAPAAESSLIPVPDSVSDEAASQFLVNPCTAYGFLELAEVPEGEYFLQNAANSVLGRQLIAMAKHRGVKTINIVRRRQHFDELKELGADEVICSSDEDVAARVKEITGGKGAWVAIDPVAGPGVPTLTKSLRDFGTLYVYSNMSVSDCHVPVDDLLYRGVVVKGFWLGVWMGSLGAKAGDVLKNVMDLLEQKVVVPFSGEKFPLERVKEAVAASGKASQNGKVFLEG